MKLLSRMFVLALVLATSGIVQPLACQSLAEIGCADEEGEHADCSDCRHECGICIACPLSAAPSMPSCEPVAAIEISAAIVPPLSDLPASAPQRAPFQPPDA
jgi:hypothetical protein